MSRGQRGRREGLQASLEGGLGGAGGDCPRSLLLNSDYNIIGDKGCQLFSGGGWPRVKGVCMSINLNISGYCGVREEGCRTMAKRKERLEWINCKLVVIQVMAKKSD